MNDRERLNLIQNIQRAVLEAVDGMISVSIEAAKVMVELLKEQEPKPGKWILDDEDANSWECSECGGLLLINDGTPLENDWSFCPYCGSKLEEQAVKCE